MFKLSFTVFALIFSACTFFLAFTSPAQASELTINPGLWKTTTTTSNSLLDQTQTETTEECVKETSFKPEELTQDLEECEVVRNELSGNTLNFDMACSASGAAVTISGVYTAEEDTGHGAMDMKMSMQGMDMEINLEWTSERIGDC